MEKTPSKKCKYETTHARHDPAHCLAPGLFRSLQRGARKKEKLDITYQYGDTTIRFWGPEPLGVDDMRILQGLVAMAAISGKQGRGIILTPTPNTEAGYQLRMFLEPKWEALERDAMVAKGSYRQLAKEIGYAKDGGKCFQLIRRSIERLWAVSVIVEQKGRRMGFRVLSQYASDENDGRLFVALNPLIAEAVLGGRHVHIEMSEVRALKSDPARLIHQRLCGWIAPGKSGRVELDTLCEYVWPDSTPTQRAIRKRRQTARSALAELVELGWKVHEYACEKFHITRPSFRIPPPY